MSYRLNIFRIIKIPSPGGTKLAVDLDDWEVAWKGSEAPVNGSLPTAHFHDVLVSPP